jgi:DMSO/TMAO reductase YedYZ heme-binding membrane subunit
MFAVAKKFVHHVMPGVIRPIHILWNQVIGFVFIVLALLPAHAIWRDWGKNDTGPRLALEVIFALLMAGYGVHSFLKARKISKS